MNLHTLSCLAALSLAGSPVVVRAAEPIYFLLASSDLECLKSHADDYLPEGNQTSFITVADCGTGAGGTVNLLDQVLNSAPDIPVSPDDGPDAVIALSAKDFECLQGLEIPQGDTIVAFYPESCDVQLRD